VIVARRPLTRGREVSLGVWEGLWEVVVYQTSDPRRVLSIRRYVNQRQARSVFRTALALLLGLVSGCGTADRETPIDWARPMVYPPLTLYFEQRIAPADRTLAYQAAIEHYQVTATSVAGYVQQVTLLRPVISPRRVFVHRGPFLESPLGTNERGYVDDDGDVHVALGLVATLPVLTQNLVVTWWYPGGIPRDLLVTRHPPVTLLSVVLAEQSALVARLEFLRGVP
jgi:hypothetical protein